jgi:hypothetical protein
MKRSKGMQTMQPKWITIWHTAIGMKFSPANPALLTAPAYAAAKLSPRLAKFFAQAARGGKSSIKVKGAGKR